MRVLASICTKFEIEIATCGVKRTWVSISAVRPFRRAIGALLSPTAAQGSRLGVLQTGTLRAGEASIEWDRSLII